MSAEILRRAASLMRERASVATPGPWHPEPSDGDVWAHLNREGICRMRSFAYGPDAEHVASWHPGVAMESATLLDNVAAYYETTPGQVLRYALTVARAYLGEPA